MATAGKLAWIAIAHFAGAFSRSLLSSLLLLVGLWVDSRREDRLEKEIVLKVGRPADELDWPVASRSRDSDGA
jgi:hypothetical protein